MPDNAQPGGTGDVYRTKDRAGVETQIVGIDVGIGGGTELLMSPSNPMPVGSQDLTLTGTITATDAVLGTHNGLGAVLTGTPTANSYVAMPINGQSGFTLRLSGTFGGGTVWIESSPDSTNGVDGGWTTNLMRQSGIDITFVDASITGAGVFRGVAAGYSYVRVRVTGATTPSIGVVFRAAASPSVTALVASIPPGSNIIGKVWDAQKTAGAPVSNTVGTTAGSVLAANTNRTGVLLVNAGATTIYLRFDGVAPTTALYSWRLDPGDRHEMMDGPPSGQIQAIGSAAAGTLLVTEMTV